MCERAAIEAAYEREAAAARAIMQWDLETLNARHKAACRELDWLQEASHTLIVNRHKSRMAEAQRVRDEALAALAAHPSPAQEQP